MGASDKNFHKLWVASRQIAIAGQVLIDNTVQNHSSEVALDQPGDGATQHAVQADATKNQVVKNRNMQYGANATVQLFAAGHTDDDEVLAAKITTPDGWFYFCNVPSGEYSLKLTLPDRTKSFSLFRDSDDLEIDAEEGLVNVQISKPEIVSKKPKIRSHDRSEIELNYLANITPTSIIALKIKPAKNS